VDINKIYIQALGKWSLKFGRWQTETEHDLDSAFDRDVRCVIYVVYLSAKYPSLIGES
jgi:hypothetical protein